MNKREVVWLIVRLIGLYFAYSAAVALFSVAGAGYNLFSLTSTGGRPDIENATPLAAPGFPRPQVDVNASNKTDPAAEKIKGDAFKTVLWYLFLTALYGGLAFYLLRRGRALFEILSNEQSPERRESDPAVTTLKL
jgi:hypothetical protein